MSPVTIIGGAVGLIAGGFPGAIFGLLASAAADRKRRRPPPSPPTRLVLLLLLIELRSGMSVLAALQRTTTRLPGHAGLRRVARVATVSGLTAALAHAEPGLRPAVAQLARAQRSGSSLSGAVRRLIEQDLAEERARRLARARSLPVKLMIPLTLLMLPGLVLFLYAPTFFRLFDDLTGAWP